MQGFDGQAFAGFKFIQDFVFTTGDLPMTRKVVQCTARDCSLKDGFLEMRFWPDVAVVLKRSRAFLLGSEIR